MAPFAPLLVFVGLLALIGVPYHMRRLEASSYQETWRQHNIDSYVITVRHGGGLIDKFDSEELGDRTTLTVINGQLARVDGPYSDETPLDQFYSYTVEGLFRKAPEYRYVQYDPIYGFPTRLGGRQTWAIEVVNFRLLPRGYHPEANP